MFALGAGSNIILEHGLHAQIKNYHFSGTLQDRVKSMELNVCIIDDIQLHAYLEMTRKTSDIDHITNFNSFP